jgi:tetratricopeptide (TPR) repeat protein
MVGVAIGLAFTLRNGLKVAGARPVLIGLTLGLALLSARQTLVWRSTGALFAQASRVNSRSLAVLLHGAYDAQVSGDLATAERLYRQVLERNASHLPTRYHLGNVLLRAGRPAEAVTQYQMVAANRPLHEQLYLNLGTALAQTQRPREALSAFNMAIESNPRSAEGYARLGACHEMLGDLKEASASYNRALALDPAQPIALEGRKRLDDAIR